MTTDPTAVIHDPDDDLTWERLARHLTGESPADESAETVAWAAAEAERARLLESSALSLALAQSELAALTGAPASGVRAEEAWPDFEARMEEEEPALSGPVSSGHARTSRGERGARAGAVSPTGSARAIVLPADRHHRRRRRTTGILLKAAGVVFVLGTAALLYRKGAEPARTVRAPAVAPRPAEPPREFATRRGQRSTFHLVDGTRVILGPGSILRVRSGLTPGAATGPREVALEGEAFFDVRPDEARPFVVHGAVGVARDLGTSFAVRSYTQERAMRVAVMSGFVSLRAAGASDPAAPVDTLLLRAGDAAETSPGALTRLPATEVAPLLAWTRDTLAFADAPLSRVAAEIERWYAVRVIVADSALARERLTAVVPRGELSEVLDVVRLALGVRLERERGRVVLHRQ